MALAIAYIIHVTLLFIQSGRLHAFHGISSSSTHAQITTQAALKVTADACESVAALKGTPFVLPPGPLTADSVEKACNAAASAKHFRSALNRINERNSRVDSIHFLDRDYHFDNEQFAMGQKHITTGIIAVKESVKRMSFETAREKLGEILHILQDFYSHSNWVELGNTSPYPNLLRQDLPIDNVADNKTPTCRSCVGKVCKNNILDNIIREKKLTSGYFSITSASKPAGKCSHGELSDKTSTVDPTGGINKDTELSSHGHLHKQATDLAVAASTELLSNIRGAAGDTNFLRLMGIGQSSSVLCFAIDTTGSMSDDIAEVNRVTTRIVDSKKGTVDEPSEYILVPFNDPSFGPVMRTTDSEKFKAEIARLTAHDGGDTPEMSLSGLQLALTNTPPLSEIYVFTDAPAKDFELKGTVMALISSTKSKVNFMITNILTERRRKRSASGISLYQSLAEASGGQVIEVTKGTLPQATSIIIDTARSSLVTIFQAVKRSGSSESFSFTVDPSVKDLVIYVTGRSPTFTVTNPSGESQANSAPSGPVGAISNVGNFYTIRPKSSGTVGLWKISVSSSSYFSVKVMGQSLVDFIYDFVEVIGGSHPTYGALAGQPLADGNATLYVSVIGGDSVKLTEVALVEISGSNVIKGSLQSLGLGNFMVNVNRVPRDMFVVRMMGTINGAPFQRQSATQVRPSGISIKTKISGTWEPGKTFAIPFTLSSKTGGGTYSFRVRNDLGYTLTFPSTLTLTGSSAEGTITITAPVDTVSGTEVTLTIEAESAGAADANYAIIRLAVVAPVTDFTPPVCEVTGVNVACSGDCSRSTWQLFAYVTDGKGSGIDRIKVQHGSGTLTTSKKEEGGTSVTLVTYTASCCSQEVELAAVDAVGNVGTCFRSIRTTLAPTTPTTTIPPTTPAQKKNPLVVYLSVFLNLFKVHENSA
ncbi:von Willebrand factor A domain-containing protein 7-like [Denticeps clupeoides]|uniref:von Willebrand factor A domain-containing protein 7-like n=1 Tax=Denticeps clupeoides TaxID=299321 RepID=A0AAY4A9X2_9TELE|nr:von Willebrand factor A domain-containing protein 7-like [Denticeps clupeoides]